MNSLKLLWKILNWKHGVLAYIIVLLTVYSFEFVNVNHLSYWYIILVFFPLLWALWMFGCYIFTDKKYKKYWRIKK